MIGAGAKDRNAHGFPRKGNPRANENEGRMTLGNGVIKQCEFGVLCWPMVKTKRTPENTCAAAQVVRILSIGSECWGELTGMLDLF